jgi:hypothetical protein
MSLCKPTSLRKIGEELGTSRKRLLRAKGDGLPLRKRGESFAIDYDVARAWFAAEDAARADTEKTAPTLHPDDPRYRIRLTLARKLRLKIEIGANLRFPAADIAVRARLEATKARTALLEVPKALTASDYAAPDFEARLAAMLEEGLSHLQADDESTWPEARAVPDLDEAEAPMEFEPETHIPRIVPSDPRHGEYTMKAITGEEALAEFTADHLPRADVLEDFKLIWGDVRSRVRAITFDPPADEETLTEEIRGVLDFVSGGTITETASLDLEIPAPCIVSEEDLATINAARIARKLPPYPEERTQLTEEEMTMGRPFRDIMSTVENEEEDRVSRAWAEQQEHEDEEHEEEETDDEAA